MVDVEAIKLAVAHEIDAGPLLGVQHHPRRIHQRLFRRRRGEPIRNRIRADNGGLDPRRSVINVSERLPSGTRSLLLLRSDASIG